jgi:hypothetical protein
MGKAIEQCPTMHPTDAASYESASSKPGGLQRQQPSIYRDPCHELRSALLWGVATSRRSRKNVFPKVADNNTNAKASRHDGAGLVPSSCVVTIIKHSRGC